MSAMPEFRTALNVVLGFAQLLELDDLTPEQRECVEEVLRGGYRLLDLVEQLPSEAWR